MRHLVAVSVSIVLLCGCAVGPDYRRPVIDTPAAWRIEEQEAKDFANTTWWEQFDDQVLNDLIRTALRENKDVKIAAGRVEEFMGRYGVTRAALFPQVTASGSALEQGFSNFTNPLPSPTLENPGNFYQAFLNGSWQVDLWGQLRRSTEAARADLLSTNEARRGVILTVVAAAAITYTDLLGLDKQLDIAERTAKARENSFNLFTLRFERGLISELELRQAESEYRSALATIPFLQKLIGQQEDALSVLLGRNPGPIPRGKQIDDLVLPFVPTGLPSSLLEKRPDISQAEQDLIAANARIGVAKALYFPTIFLTGTYGVASRDLSFLFTGPAKAWTYAVPAVMPIFTGGSIAGQVKAAESVQQQALFRYQRAIQQAFREVEDALIDQNKSRQMLGIQRQQVEALRSYARLAELRYENGYTSYLEVLDAQRSLFQGELLYVQTQSTLFRALVNLYRAMGGGWVAEADKLTGDKLPGG
ncbi:MAG: efflux transporter outer membrane subunit [Syntrophales bacterium LBB04]|nr:efflux transporter outer membrane subunit [Syntrophales bacterium LBB04]